MIWYNSKSICAKKTFNLVNEQQCSTVNERKCSTVNKQQCSTVNEQQCNTVNEQQCRTVQKQECSTVNEQVLLCFKFQIKTNMVPIGSILVLIIQMEL